MKKILSTILILLALVSISFAQSNGLIMTSKVITWTDSLGYSGSDTLAVADSVWILPINFRTDYFRIYLDANANSAVDSIGIELGAKVYTSAGVCTDTTWGSYIGVKDSAWNTLNVLVNNTTGKDYSLFFMPPVDLMKLSLLNYRAALTTRNVRVTIQGTKD